MMATAGCGLNWRRRSRRLQIYFSGTIHRHHELVLRRGHRVGGVFLDEGVGRIEPLLVEIIGDRLVGVVHRVVGAAVSELERLAAGRLADGDVALRQLLRLLGDRHRGLELEAGVVRLGVDRHGRAGALDALLVQQRIDRLERIDQVVERLVPGAVALQIDDGLWASASPLRRTDRRAWRSAAWSAARSPAAAPVAAERSVARTLGAPAPSVSAATKTMARQGHFIDVSLSQSASGGARGIGRIYHVPARAA